MRVTVHKEAKEICLTLSFKEWVALPSGSDSFEWLPVKAEDTLRALLATLDAAVLATWPPEQENPFFEL
jgi:hypothetical protein